MVEMTDIDNQTPVLGETGVFIRNYGVALLGKLRSLRERHNRVSSVMLVQADQSNTTASVVANSLLKNIRSSDHLVQWDDDRFLLILPETGRANGIAAGEKLRALFAAYARQLGQRVTISAAVAEINHLESDAALEKRLRLYLDAAREAGGNQTRAFA
jgi:hypothetical protein